MTQSEKHDADPSREVALIVGGGPGISASCARLFAGQGMRVGVAARDPDKAALQTLEKTHGVRRYGCDASEPAAVEMLFQSVVRDLGAPTLVVHNIDGRMAGIFRKSITEADPMMALETLRNSAFSAFLVGQQAARLMRDNIPNTNGVKGTIIFTNASAALKGFPTSGAFAMACQAKSGLAQSMARELMPQGIHVANVPIDAAIGWTQEDGSRAHRLAGTTVDDNMADPDRIAETIYSCTVSIDPRGRSKSCCVHGSRSGEPLVRLFPVRATETRGGPMSANNSEWKSTACILCECNCGVEVQLGGTDGRHLVKVRGDDAHPASKGYACEKAHRLDFYQNGPHRLTKPLRRRSDGSFEELDWDTAIAEVAARLSAVREAHGGETIFYFGGGGQGNHFPAIYNSATRAALGSIHRSSALAQEKTGEFWVARKMVGFYTRSDFEHAEVAFFLGKNPWQSHSFPHARVTLKEIAKDPSRCLIVVDPRRTESAELADIHLQVKPGTDAWLLAGMLGVLVQEKLLASEWLARHAEGLTEVLPHFRELPVAQYCQACGVPEDLVRKAARRIAAAASVASFEDLGVQMNRHSTLVSYLHKLLMLLTGNFGKQGSAYVPTMMVPFTQGNEGGAGVGAISQDQQDDVGPARLTPVTGALLIGGLTPCNVIPDEILTDHPKRFRAMVVECANPAHSLADSVRMREALSSLELLVTIDVTLSETARLGHYVLPVASQFEKAEATFFNFEFPHNYFHLRRPLMPPLHGLFSEAELHCRLLEALGELPAEPIAALRAAWKQSRQTFRETVFQLAMSDPRLITIAPALLYRAIGDLLPEGLAEAAGAWLLCQTVAQIHPGSLARAGFTGEPGEAGDALFDAILAAKSGIVFAIDDWKKCLDRLRTPTGKVQLAIPELFVDLDGLATTTPSLATEEFPFLLSAGERRSFTANTIIRNPDWRKKDPGGALSINPEDAKSVGVVDGARARLTTRRGSAEVLIQVSDRLQRGHVSLPNGLGLDFPGADGRKVTVGVGPNELTRSEDRDRVAGTPWHKSTPARLEPL